MTKQDLLANIKRDRAQLDALVARVGEARMTEPSLEGGWSVKDVLAHVSAWEKIGMALVRNNQPVQPPPPGATGPSTDLINERIYEGSKDRPLGDVLEEAKRSNADLLALVESLSDKALKALLGAGQEGAEGSPRVGELIGANTHEHYREHREEVETWRRSLRRDARASLKGSGG